MLKNPLTRMKPFRYSCLREDSLKKLLMATHFSRFEKADAPPPYPYTLCHR